MLYHCCSRIPGVSGQSTGGSLGVLYQCCSRIPGVSGQSTGGSLGVLYHCCSGYLVSVVSQPVVA